MEQASKMKPSFHDLSFPVTEPGTLAQDEAYFLLREGGQELRLRFHDYDEIYRRPGLYEQLFYERLRCTSPRKARDVLLKVLQENHEDIHSRRVLDLGAGNGMVGELLDAARVVGVDISEAARDACVRDRPHAYDAYYVADMAHLARDTAAEMKRWQLDCMTCIAALGFGDIPVPAFAQSFNLIKDGGWVVFNIKETFLREGDSTGFSRLVQELMMSETLEVHHLERYRHRLSIDGEPLFYFVMVGRKRGDIGGRWLTDHRRA
jgi:predicted TPR repeat methyltransferase